MYVMRKYSAEPQRICTSFFFNLHDFDFSLNVFNFYMNTHR